MWDIAEEIWNTLKKNKLRTFLTGFSVAWGIFMLIVLLGAGNGLKHGMEQSFGRWSTNTLMLWPGRTSVPYEGLPKDRRINFREGDDIIMADRETKIEHISPVIEMWGTTLSYGNEYGAYSLTGVNPHFPAIVPMEIKSGNGRFINSVDMAEKRKVIVIHRKVADILFRNENPLGKYLQANDIAFQVVGIYDDDNTNQYPAVYIPLTTAQAIYNPISYNSIDMTIGDVTTVEGGKKVEGHMRGILGRLKTFFADDPQAIYVWNVLENYLQTMGIFNGITLFVWVIGIGTLVAGIVGVSNIMLITVKERTHEFGIRKALGASPASVLKLVLAESLLITVCFGYVGMVAGIGVTELASSLLGNIPGERVIFKDPTVDLSIAIVSTLVLVIAGVLAGYFPAKKAVGIRPIEALRSE